MMRRDAAARSLGSEGACWPGGGGGDAGQQGARDGLGREERVRSEGGKVGVSGWRQHVLGSRAVVRTGTGGGLVATANREACAELGLGWILELRGNAKPGHPTRTTNANNILSPPWCCWPGCCCRIRWVNWLYQRRPGTLAHCIILGMASADHTGSLTDSLGRSHQQVA